MKYLNAVDYTVMAVYVCCLVGLALYLKRLASASLEDYFLGGKKLPWWALGVSGMASFLDITGTMIIVAFLFMLGPRGLFIEFRGGAVLILVFMMLWTGKWHRRSNCMTVAEWQIYRFGAGRDGQFARIVSAFAATALPIGGLAYMARGVGPFFSTFIPLSPTVCAIILMSIAAIYTMVSGFYGVVFTDMFQSLIILTAVIVISTMAIGRVTDAQSLATVAEHVTGNGDWLSAVPHWETPMPAGYEQYELLFLFMFSYLMKNVSLGIGSGGDPKFFGARNERECGKLTFMWTWLMMFRWPMMMGFAVLGLFLVNDMFPDQSVLREAEFAIKRQLLADQSARIPDFDAAAKADAVLKGRVWARDVDRTIAEAQANTGQSERLATLFGQEWPDTLRTIASDRAAIGEAIPQARWADITANVANDPDAHPALAAQMKSLFGDQWKDKLKMVSYNGTVDPERILPSVLLFVIPIGFRGLLLVALLAASMSTFDSNVNAATGFFTRDLYQTYMRPRASTRELIYASYVFIAIVVVGGFALGYTSKNINDIWSWIIMSLTSGLAIPGILRLYWWRFNAGGVIASTIVGLFATLAQRFYLPDLGEWSQFGYISLISFTGAVVGTFVARPTDPRVLEHFYKTTRPFGLWGPVKRTLPVEERKAITREHFYDLVSVPFALCWQVTLFLLPMLLIVHNWRGAAAVAVIFGVSLMGLLLLWYRHLPPDRDGVPDGGDLDYVMGLFGKAPIKASARDMK